MTTREDPISPARPAPVVTERANRFLLTPVRHHMWIIGVMVCFALTPLLVPILVPAAVGDDWVYARSVEILLREGRLHILDLSVVTLVFQIAWGSLFATLFGLTFGVLRLSTFVMTMIGGLGLLRTLPRARDRAHGECARRPAAYLFNPLTFVLAYTFMSDPFFTALLVIAADGYVRGLRCDRSDRAALLFGTAAAACAFLVRQQGALIPAAVIIALLAQRRLHRNRESLLVWPSGSWPSRRSQSPAITSGLCSFTVCPMAADIVHTLGDQCGVGAELASDRPHDVCRSDVCRAVHPAGCLSRAQRGGPHCPDPLAMGLVYRARLGGHAASGSETLQQRRWESSADAAHALHPAIRGTEWSRSDRSAGRA